MNYIELVVDVPKGLHFTDHYWVDRMVWDKDLGKEKPVRSLVMQTDREDGEPVIKTFSILSKGLAEQLAPYLPDSRFRDFDFTITVTGAGYGRRHTVDAIPRSTEAP